jgi:hypothetical protein
VRHSKVGIHSNDSRAVEDNIFYRSFDGDLDATLQSREGEIILMGATEFISQKNKLASFVDSSRRRSKRNGRQQG